jgi:MFS family permease
MSRLFLGAQYAVAITMIVEEFPPRRRASALGTLLMCNALGILSVGLLVGAGAGGTPLGWRLLFLLGLLPLVAVGFYRRKLRETRAFSEARAAGTCPRDNRSWRSGATPNCRRLLLVGTVSLLRAVPLFASIAWLAFYVTRERDSSETVLSAMFVSASTDCPTGGPRQDQVFRTCLVPTDHALSRPYRTA